MKAYYYRRQEVEEAEADQSVAEKTATAMPPEKRAAYEWNNALLIAAQKMWGDHSTM